MRAMKLAAELEELDDIEDIEELPVLQLLGSVSAPNGRPIQGAQISVRLHNGSPLNVPCTTEPDGTFSVTCSLDAIMDDAGDGASQVAVGITAKHPDCAIGATIIHLDSALGAEGVEAWASIVMVPATAAEVLPAASGGLVRDEMSGMSLHVPANAFITKSGRPFIGEAKVAIACIDPSDPDSLGMMPGDYTATDIHGNEHMLRTFGAMHVSIEAADTGESLNVRPGSELEAEWAARVPLDVLEKGGGLPSSWHYDERRGKWRQDPRPISVDGLQLPKPERVITNPDGSWKLDSTPAQAAQSEAKPVKPPRTKGSKKKKGKSAFMENVDEGLNDWSVAQFKRLFASKQGQALSMKVAAGGWYNIDSTYLAVLLTGKVLCNGGVLSLEQAVEVKKVKVAKNIDLNGDLLHQGCNPHGDLNGDPLHQLKRMGAVRVAAVGVDYGSASYARASSKDGVFEIVCQHQSQVRLEVEVDPQPGSTERLVWKFGPFETGELGDILDVGALEIDLGTSRL